MRQLEVWLKEATECFPVKTESYVSSIPPTVLNVKMGELVDKYGGDIMLCMKAQAVENCKWINQNATALLTPPMITSQRTRHLLPPTTPTIEFAPTPPSANTQGVRKRKREVKFDLTPPSADTRGVGKRKHDVKINHKRRRPWRGAGTGVFD